MRFDSIIFPSTQAYECVSVAKMRTIIKEFTII